MLLPQAICAAPVNWTGSSATSPNWNDAANWNPGVPTTGDDLFFGSATGRTTTAVDQNFSVASITFNAGAPSYTTGLNLIVSLGLTGAGIINNSSVAQNFVLANGGGLQFSGASTASSGVTVTANGGAAGGPGGGITTFSNTASAGSATLIANGTALGGTSTGLTQFFNTATAGSAIVTANGGTVSSRGGGSTVFFDTATAGNATVTANGAAASGAGEGITKFLRSSTAGSATLVTNGPGVSGARGGSTFFSESTDGGTARAITNAGGVFDISSLDTTGMKIGSIEGAGAYNLGSKNLRAGGNNLSATVSGVIADGGNFGGTGGSLTKEGTGALVLAGTNTYSGGTTINGGSLLVANINTGKSSATGSGAVRINAGGTLGGGNSAANGGSLSTTTLRTYDASQYGIVGGAVSVASGGILAPGNGVGTLTVNALTLQLDCVLDYEFNATANDFTAVTGTSTLSISRCGFHLYIENSTLAFGTPGRYHLLGYNGSLGDVDRFFVFNPVSGLNYTFVDNPSIRTVDLLIADPIPEPSTTASVVVVLGALCLLRCRKRCVA